ncbi:MAG: hypothetical protein ACLU37_01740 [Collinsella sp.]
MELSDRVIAEPSKIDVAERVCEVLGVESDSVPACSDGDVVDALGRSRLGVKIQDGCNHRCTYCMCGRHAAPSAPCPSSPCSSKFARPRRPACPRWC